MPKTLVSRAALVVVLTGLSLAVPAHADEGPELDRSGDWLLGGSVVSGTGHIGSGGRSTDLKPLWSFQIGSLKVSRSRANALMSAGRGEAMETGVSTDLFTVKDWRLGASLRVDNGRSFARDERWQALPDVRTTVRVRVSAAKPLDANWNLSLSADQDLLGRGGGMRMAAGVGRRWVLTPDTQMDLSLGSGWGNAAYLNNEYGIAARDARAAGVLPYGLTSSLDSLRLGLHFATALSPNWVVFSGVDVSRLLGQASRSPLVGRTFAHSLTLGLAYRNQR
jgi:outer membrane protein